MSVCVCEKERKRNGEVCVCVSAQKRGVRFPEPTLLDLSCSFFFRRAFHACARTHTRCPRVCPSRRETKNWTKWCAEAAEHSTAQLPHFPLSLVHRLSYLLSLFPFSCLHQFLSPHQITTEYM